MIDFIIGQATGKGRVSFFFFFLFFFRWVSFSFLFLFLVFHFSFFASKGICILSMYFVCPSLTPINLELFYLY